MKERLITVLIHLAHLSAKLKSLGEEIDKIYEIVGDKEFLETIEQTKKTEKE